MVMRNAIYIPVLLMLLFASCSTQSPKKTVSKALKNIEAKDYKAMKNLIGTGIEQDTFMEGIVSKMVRISYFLDKYHAGSTKNLKPIYTDSVDEMGRKIITVPLYKAYDSLTGLYNANIILMVGPFNLFSPDELTGFEVERGVDVPRRRFILDNNLPTYDFDSVTYVEYNKLKQ